MGNDATEQTPGRPARPQSGAPEPASPRVRPRLSALAPDRYARYSDVAAQVQALPEAEQLAAIRALGPDDADIVPFLEAMLEQRASDPGMTSAGRRIFGAAAAAAVESGGAEPPLPARIGRYPILRRLGAGGMGVVYEAVDERLGRRIALKTLPHELTALPQHRAWLEQEARAAAVLSHPGIVTIHSVENDDETVFLTMERVEGDTLTTRIGDGGLPAATLLDWGIQLADAVAAAHASGVVHRDLKPGNVIVAADGRLKILDFGLAWREEGQPGGGSNTTTRGLFGTPAYMSPEHVEGRSLDARTDIWALGVMLYEMANGRRPFEGDSGGSLAASVLRDAPPPLAMTRPDLPAEFTRIVQGCLEKSRERRTPSAVRLRDALRLLRQPSLVSAEARSPAARAGNLPARLSSFIGRERTIEELSAALEGTRLLTLTGVGGCGKTRLALELADRLAPAWPDGTWLASLGPLSQPELVVRQVATALGVEEEGGVSLEAAITGHLRDRKLLLILDNCEHLLGETARLATTLLAAAPGLTVLATSREAFGVAGEVVRLVPSLAIPEPAATVPATEAVESVQLFVRRGAAVRSGFTLTERNVADVVAICRRLDGMPLAIELAAARLDALSTRQLVARLDDAFRLLTGGSRTALERHQTLFAALEWSHDLLAEPERVLYRRLSVFQGGWTLEQAEQVCADELLDAREVLDRLAHLVAQSLVIVDRSGEFPRYRYLEPLRQHARDKLVAAGEAERLRDRHLDAMIAIAEEAFGPARGSDQAIWLRRLSADHENLRAAAERCAEVAGGAAKAVRLVIALLEWWAVRGHWAEGRRLIAAVTSRTHELPRDLALARVHLADGILASEQGDIAAARRAYEESLALHRELGEKRGIGGVLCNLAALAVAEEDDAAARTLLEEALVIVREAGSRQFEANVLSTLANVHRHAGEYDTANALIADAIAIDKGLGDPRAVGVRLTQMGEIAALQGDAVRSRTLHEEALALCTEIGEPSGLLDSHLNLGMLALDSGDLAAARTHVDKALRIARELAHRPRLGAALLQRGLIAVEDGDWVVARAHLEESLALLRSLGSPGDTLLCLRAFLGVLSGETRQAQASRLLDAVESLARTTPLPRQPPPAEARAARMATTIREACRSADAVPGRVDGALSLDEACALALDAPAGRA